MAPLARRVVTIALLLLVSFVVWHRYGDPSRTWLPARPGPFLYSPDDVAFEHATGAADDMDGDWDFASPEKTFDWALRKEQYPVKTMVDLPSGPPARIPQIQFPFGPESSESRDIRKKRLARIKEAFEHTWKGYKDNAWGEDEVLPLSGRPKSKFGDWGATLVDTLDMLWIVGMRDEFNEAIKALDRIDFSSCGLHSLNVFETTIRYLGGFLGAYDLSKNKVLLQKAEELGQMLYAAFDTKSRMPISRWDWLSAKQGKNSDEPSRALLAEIGSLSLEFTRLSQLTGNPKYYDAIARITEIMRKEQSRTHIPGLWPISVNPEGGDFSSDVKYTMGGMADSAFEYLPKQWLLLGGRAPEYREMYESALTAAKRHLTFATAIPVEAYENILSSHESPLFLGTARASSSSTIYLDPIGEHLACFTGGMVSLAAQLFSSSSSAPSRQVSYTTSANPELAFGARLTAGCIWSYNVTASGIGPEIWHAAPCAKGEEAIASGVRSSRTSDPCHWDRNTWLKQFVVETDDITKSSSSSSSSDDEEPTSRELDEAAGRAKILGVPEGMSAVPDPRYLLRPEAIEAVFILYRITGDAGLREHAWRMFESIDRAARTDIAYAELDNVLASGVPHRASPGIDGASHDAAAEEGEDADAEPIGQSDSMESFWTAETLKYFYLLFEEEDVVSLDRFVFNTEAHPLRWKE